MITTNDSLQEFIDAIRPVGRVGLDTEADSLHCYFEKLCLIQISIPGHDVLIDPLASDLSLQPLFDELQRHEVILQGLDYDLRLLRRAGLEEVQGVFDTMIAARLIGCREFSLAALLQRYFGVELVKGSQKANWAKRPLSPKMAEYAVNDTRYLADLAARLEAELARLGRLEWLHQTVEKAIASTRVQRERDAENAWRITGSGDLRGRAAALMRELWRWRDEEARSVDRPTFHMMRNDELIAAARTFAEGGQVTVKHLSGGRKRRFYEAADRGLALPEGEWPRFVRTHRQRPTPEQELRFAEYRKIRDAAAAKLDIESSLIAPKVLLEALAADLEKNLPSLLPWQRELLNLG